MLKKISLVLILSIALSATSDFQIAGEAMTKAVEEKARYEALNSVISDTRGRLDRLELELFIDKILFVVIACVKISI